MASLPRTGHFVDAVIDHEWSLSDFGITIDDDAINALLNSSAFTESFSRLANDLVVALPLNFSTRAAELNVISIISLLNFASGYRVPLHKTTDRGAWDTIRYLVISLYLDSHSDGEGNLLSAKGMASIDDVKIASLLNINIHREVAHPTIPGLVIGEKAGPLYELVSLIRSVLNETGSVLVQQGYPDLGSFVLEAFKEGSKHPDMALDIIVERIVTAFPAMRDMATVDGKNIYVFKKAFFLVLAVANRFGKAQGGFALPIPDITRLPVMSDNVLPSMLVYFGVINLNHCTFGSLRGAFQETDRASLLASRGGGEPVRLDKSSIQEGPTFSASETYVLRAAAIDACEKIVATAKTLGDSFPEWLTQMTRSQLDMWLWSVAKDRSDYRKLPRFVEQSTPFY